MIIWLFSSKFTVIKLQEMLFPHLKTCQSKTKVTCIFFSCVCVRALNYFIKLSVKRIDAHFHLLLISMLVHIIHILQEHSKDPNNIFPLS